MASVRITNVVDGDEQFARFLSNNAAHELAEQISSCKDIVCEVVDDCGKKTLYCGGAKITGIHYAN